MHVTPGVLFLGVIDELVDIALAAYECTLGTVRLQEVVQMWRVPAWLRIS
jgi:hypothetical protein